MKKPIHLAIVTPFPPSATSIGQYCYYISRALALAGVFEQITVLTEIGSNTQPVQLLHGIRVERLWRRNCTNASWKIAARLHQLKPDLVWYNLGASMFGNSLLASVFGLCSPALSRVADLPSVVTIHEIADCADLRTLDVPGGRLAIVGARLIRFLMTRTDVVCVTLQQHLEWLAERYSNMRLIHIPHGVFDPPELLESCGETNLLMFAHLAPFKGLELLLDVFRTLHLQYPALRLTVAGEEHPRFPGYVKRIRNAFGEHPAVQWLGCVPEVELRNIFARATIIVVPRLATTGSSSVVYRAAGWGRPIVGSDLSELRALAEEEGLWIEFCPCNDAVGLAASIARLLTNPARRRAQAHHNYRTVLRHLTLSHTCQAYLHAFNLALATHNSDIRIPIALQPTPEVL